MPQFDPSFFPSQIFWLAVCFAVLYLAMCKIYLPRIKSILSERRKAIEQNSLASDELQKKIDQINSMAEENKNSASKQYQIAMEQAAKQGSLNREKALNDLKRKTDQMVAHSEKQIIEVIENSKKNSEAVIKNLVETLSKKIFQEQSDTNSIAINHNE